jgi:radical SAM-linked protein
MLVQRIRARFQKRGELRVISHLDVMRAFERALFRTQLPLRMSEGFNPKPRVSFPVALGVGIEGLDEAMEFDLRDWLALPEVERRLREQLPSGLDLLSLRLTDPRTAARAVEVEYRVTLPLSLRDDPRAQVPALDALLARPDVPVRRLRKGKEKTVNLRAFIRALTRDGETLVMTFTAGPDGSAHPDEVLGALGIDTKAAHEAVTFTRTRVQLAD